MGVFKSCGERLGIIVALLVMAFPVCKCTKIRGRDPSELSVLDRNPRSIHVMGNNNLSGYSVVVYDDLSNNIANVNIAILGSDEGHPNIPYMDNTNSNFLDTVKAVQNLSDIDSYVNSFIMGVEDDLETFKINRICELIDIIFGNLNI